MSDDNVSVPRKFLENLARDPDLVKKVIRAGELAEFKEKYGVTRSTGLKCPACSAYFTTGGSLWGPMKDTVGAYVCRKCGTIWHLECVSKPIMDVIDEVRGIMSDKRKSK